MRILRQKEFINSDAKLEKIDKKQALLGTGLMAGMGAGMGAAIGRQKGKMGKYALAGGGLMAGITGAGIAYNNYRLKHKDSIVNSRWNLLNYNDDDDYLDANYDKNKALEQLKGQVNKRRK